MASRTRQLAQVLLFQSAPSPQIFDCSRVPSFVFIALVAFSFALASKSLAQRPESQEKGSLELEWEASRGAKSFEVKVEGSGFSQVYNVEQPALKVELPLGTYNVQVRNITQQGRKGKWSDILEVPVQPFQIQKSQPAQDKKLEAGASKSIPVRFEWKSHPRARTYRLFIWESEKEPQLYMTTRTTYDLKLDAEKSYTWTVLGDFEGGIDYEQNASKYTFHILGQQLAAPQLMQAQMGRSGFFKWNQVPEAQSYRVEIRTRPIDGGPWQVVETLDSTEQHVLRKPWIQAGFYEVLLQSKSSLRPSSKERRVRLLLKPKPESGGRFEAHAAIFHELSQNP